jgi:hypothetical protein
MSERHPARNSKLMKEIRHIQYFLKKRLVADIHGFSEIPHIDPAQYEELNLDDGNRRGLMGTKNLLYTLTTDRIIISSHQHNLVH